MIKKKEKKKTKQENKVQRLYQIITVHQNFYIVHLMFGSNFSILPSSSQFAVIHRCILDFQL